MKRLLTLFSLKTLLLQVFLLGGISTLHAQMYQSIFVPASSNVFPLNDNTNNKVQWLYLPSEITPATAPGGFINKIYLNVSNTTTSNITYSDFTVSLGSTTATATTATYFTGLQQCYYAASLTVPGLAAGNWFEITLQNPYLWDGVTSLIVEVKKSAHTGTGYNMNQYNGNGNRRTWGGFAAATGTGGTGQVKLGFDMLPGIEGTNNAGIASLLAPDTFCAGQHSVQVRVRNQGHNILNTLQVQWTMNGVAQTPVNITTPIDTFGSVAGNERDVTLGTYNFGTAPVILKAWTTLPNGGVDTINGNDTILATLTPSVFTLNSTQDTICANATANITISPSGGYPGTGVTWESSTNGGTTWSTIAGASGNSYLATGLATPTTYRATVNVGSGTCVTTTQHIEVFHVTSPTTTGASRCGEGSVVLSASVNGPGVLQWYENAVGGPPIGSGTSFATPNISTTTTFYVTAGDGGGSGDSIAVPLANGNTTGVYHNMFLVSSTTNTTITEIGLKVNSGVGTMTAWDIYYRPDNYQLVPGANTSATGWTLLSSTTNVPSLGPNEYTTIAQNLNLAIPAGATYSLYIAPVNGTHQYSTPAAGTVVATTSSMEIKAGHRGSSLFNLSTSGGQAVVKIKTAAGCESPRIPAVATIHPLPDLDLGADLDTCTFQAIPMVLDPGTQPAGSTFIWDDFSTGSTRNVNASGTYHVTVTNQHGCVNADTIHITMREKPHVELDNGNTNICHGATTVLDAGPGGLNGGTYYWNTGATTQTITVTNPGTYIVYVTSADGCTTEDTVEVIVEGYAPTVDGIHAMALSTDSFTFSAINPQHVDFYEWDFGDGSPINISASPTHKYQASGIYLVKMRVISSCADTWDSAYVNIISVGINDNSGALSDLKVYPNPNSTGLVNISTGDEVSIEKIALVNVLGQVIKTYTSFESGQTRIEIPEHTANGIYYLKIDTNKGSTTRKIEINK